MNMNHRSFTTRAMVIAVHGALLAMAAMPAAYAEEDPAVAELTQPTSTVEVGVTDVSHASAKAGEYNGLNKQGGTAIVNFDVRGGGSYDTENTTRMRIKGTDLGLETSNLSVEFGQQGKFKINAGYDELLRNRSDSYMTPYIGSGSSNVLTLPAGWKPPQLNGTVGSPYGFSPDKINSQILANGVLGNPTSTNQTNSYAAINADLPAFHLVNLSTKRTKKEVGFSYNIDSQWEFAASSRSEDKKGFKPMSTVSAKNQEIATTIADKIDTNTSQYNVSLAYVDEMKFFKAAYYGSIFKNNVQSMSWADWGSPAAPNTDMFTMSSAPSNQYHQVSLNGGYNFDKTTKLVMNGAYARNTQNDTYLSNGFGITELGMGVPVTSANALVVTKSFDAKLTMKPVKDLTLAAGYKLDDRNNLTAVHNYAFGDAGLAIGGTALTSASALWNTSMLGWTPTGAGAAFVDSSGRITAPTLNIEANRPYNKKLNQFNLDATYALAKGQSIRAGFDHQQIDRSCTGSWIDCMDADKTKENTVRLDWRASLTENMNVKFGLAKAKRTVDAYNENAFLALVPMANYAPVGTTANTSAGGIGGNGQGLSLYQTMQAFGITGMGPNTGYLTDTQLAAMYPNATTAQLAALKYYFGAGRTGTSAAGANGTSVANNQNGYASRNRISELIGMRRYNMADRDRNNLKAGLDWNATEQLSLQGGVNYKKDSYGNSVYGLTDGKEWGLNLDAAFAASDTLTLSAFYNLEKRVSTMANDAFGTNSDGTNVSQTATNGTVTNNSQVVVGNQLTGATQVVGGCYATVTDKNLNAKTDPCLKWSADMKDKVDTVGIVLKQNNLMANRLDVTGGLTFTRARTDTAVHGGTYIQNPLLTAATGQSAKPAFYYLRATDLPTVTTDTIDFTLRGKYKLDKSSAVHVGYRYQHMKAVNFAYDGMQMTTVVGNTMPTNETAPNYTVHTIGASYIYNF